MGRTCQIFESKAGLTPANVEATRSVPAIPDLSWHGTEYLLIRLVDALHDNADVPDDLWRQLETSYTAEQLLELIALTGHYHTISFLTNALRITPESYAPRFADKR